MSYIVKTISTEDNSEIRKINEIIRKLFAMNDKTKAEDFIAKLEEKGYVICKKEIIDN